LSPTDRTKYPSFSDISESIQEEKLGEFFGVEFGDVFGSWVTLKPRQGSLAAEVME
jgi:hypothetical protein